MSVNIESEQARRLARGATVGAVVFMVVAVALLASSGLGVLRLSDTKRALKQEVDSLMLVRGQLERENERLLKGRDAALAVVSGAEVNDFTAPIQIHASYRPLEGRHTVDGRQMFRFSLWITAPPERLEGIAEVSYKFEHPTFRRPMVSSDDRQSGFRVHYDGWGSLEVVTVTFTKLDGTSTKRAFAMTDALVPEE